MRLLARTIAKRSQNFPKYAALLLTTCGSFTAGCSNNDNGGGTSDSGVSETGGRSNVGGASASGGRTTSGGTQSTVVKSATGGSTSISTSVGTGGLAAAGGSSSTNTLVMNTGGAHTTGGAYTAGSTSTGGATNATGGNGGAGTTGGVASTSGGASSVGGVTSTGGVSTVGGASASGGTTATGGGSGIGGAGMDATVGPLRSVEVNLTGMTTDVNHLMAFRIVSANDELVSLGILDPLPTATYAFTLPMALPEGAHRLEFYADINGDRKYTPMSTDEAWSRPIPQGVNPAVNFAYNSNFTDLSTSPVVPIGEDFTLHASGMTPHVGQAFELRVIVADTGQVVGMYRFAAVPAATFDIVIPGIIANTVPYRVDFWADENGNGEYNTTPVDHAWRMTGEGSQTGLTLSFAHNTDFTDVSF